MSTTGAHSDSRPRRYWAPHAWLPEGWRSGVLLDADAQGHWQTVTTGVATPPADAERLAGPALPGLVDAHSHAFQRAFAGLAERREQADDDFWSWRDRMYQVALRITPDQLQAIAAHLYTELLAGGYTQVCEFHYLQHREDGSPYADPLQFAWSLADAAQETGIGLTVLPVLYERAGFAQPALRPDQRRFRCDADGVWQACQALAGAGRPGLEAGVAVHSLRAASPQAIRRLRQHTEDWDGPIHIHVAEQLQEVDDCLQATGARPIEWLAREGLLDARWQLVHATHTTRDEIAAVARSGAGVVLCPSTEANLGDGLADLPGWLDADVPLSLGSDSQVGRAWTEELRLLDYGQRLRLRRRNVAASPDRGWPSTAARLWSCAQAGSAAPAGFARWGLVAGARADLLVADVGEPALVGMPADRLLDAVVFSSPSRPWRDVMVGGRWAVREHRHAGAEAVSRRFADVMQAMWAA